MSSDKTWEQDTSVNIPLDEIDTYFDKPEDIGQQDITYDHDFDDW